jgi:hypothetical protein
MHGSRPIMLLASSWMIAICTCVLPDSHSKSQTRPLQSQTKPLHRHTSARACFQTNSQDQSRCQWGPCDIGWSYYIYIYIIRYI